MKPPDLSDLKPLEPRPSAGINGSYKTVVMDGSSLAGMVVSTGPYPLRASDLIVGLGGWRINGAGDLSVALTKFSSGDTVQVDVLPPSMFAGRHTIGSSYKRLALELVLQ